MINAENFIYDTVAKALRENHPGVFVSSDSEFDVKEFPAVIFSELINTTASRYMTQGPDELFSDVMYEAQAFSNRKQGRRREVKELIDTVNSVMMELGFIRTTGQSLPNINDATIARYVGRWHGTIGSDNLIYRR